MATLEDRILDPEGTKRDNYCSSSEDEDEGPVPGLKNTATFYPSSSQAAAPTTNTGPKGVLEDWRRYKQLQTEQRQEQDREMRKLANKLSMSCKTSKEDEKAKLREEDAKVIQELECDDDAFIREYMLRRMQEMMNASRAKTSAFGKLFDLNSSDEFLNCIDNDSKTATVLIHIYEANIEGCDAMNGSLACLAKEYPMVKFCRVLASLLGTTKRFRSAGLPTVQAYREGELINSFVRLTDELGCDFFSDDVESFLKDFGVLPDASAYNAAGKEVAGAFSKIRQNDEDNDSDFSID